jgi:cold-inducible RNA-binding protein
LFLPTQQPFFHQLMNPVKVFVGNLPFAATPSDLEDLFRPFGEVIGVNIREDRATGRPRGFGFVTFAEESSAQSSIDSLNGQEYCGRALTVNAATLRGSQASEEESGATWKTAPPPRSSQKKGLEKCEDSKRNQKKSWTEWASPNLQKK